MSRMGHDAALSCSGRTGLSGGRYRVSPNVPERIDARVFAKAYAGVRRLLDDVARDPDHPIRKAAERRMLDFAERLKTDPEMLSKGTDLKEELLAHPDFRAWTASLWRDTRRGLLDTTSTPGSELRLRIAATMQRLGVRLATDPDLQEHVDTSIQHGVYYVVDNYRSEVSGLIESTITKWDGPSTASAHGAPGRARPAVHPHQRHDRRVHRRRAHPRVHAGAVAGTGTATVATRVR